MAKSLLNGVNDVLEKVGVIDSGGKLASLTDTSKQVFIDTAIQSINEVLDELYSLPGMTKPNMLKEDEIILKTDDRDYQLNTALVTLRTEYDLIDEANNHTIFLLDGDDGYWQIVQQDRELNDTGLPSFAAIRPTDGQLYMDRTPTATENGKAYTYRYDRDLELTVATDEFPFVNAVYRGLIPAAAEMWKFHNHREFAQGLVDASLARAARLMNKVPERTSWKPTALVPNITDPMSDN